MRKSEDIQLRSILLDNLNNIKDTTKWKATITKGQYYSQYRLYFLMNFHKQNNFKEVFFDYKKLRFREVEIDDISNIYNIIKQLNKSTSYIIFNLDELNEDIIGSYKIEKEGDWYYLEKIENE